jgi:intein/homing endonuclease
MGPDSLPRTVQAVNSGQEEMYDIYENNVKRKFVYGCNASHILSLKYCSDDGRYGLEKGEIIDVTVKEYLSWSERKKRLFLGFRTGVQFEEKSLPIPAYILGAWIGDGTSSTTALTTMDKEMVDEWSNYAKSINMQVRVQDIKIDNKAKTYFITSDQQNGSNDRNPFMSELRSMELINNKYIPNIYKINNRHNRLEFLAGLIDTDGSMPFDGTYVFTQVKKHIVDDVEYIAKSLGFKTNVKEVPSYSYSTDEIQRVIGTCFKLTIGGNNTWEIPCRLPRKRSTKRTKSRDGSNYSIEIVPQGIGTYYGFTLEEEPHFVLGDFTVTHNTTAGRVQIAEQLLQMGLIKDAQQYFQVLNTGSLDSMFESDMNELLLIKSENEILMDGKKVLAELLDSHSQHIMEHRTVMSDPDLRMDANLRSVVQDHIQQHIDFLRTVDPDLLMLIGQKPLQNPNAPQNPPPPNAPPPAPPAPDLHLHNHQAPQVHVPAGHNTPGNTLQVQNPAKPPSLSGQGSAGGNLVPGVPKPPGEFSHLPTQASSVAQG